MRLNSLMKQEQSLVQLVNLILRILKQLFQNKASILKFQNEAKPIDDKIITNTFQIRTLSALRDTLLPKLLSGEVTVQE